VISAVAALLVASADPTARAHLDQGLTLARGGDSQAAHAELVAAFECDPELEAPGGLGPDLQQLIDIARADAVKALRARLSEAATTAAGAFRATPQPEAPELEPKIEQRPEGPPRPLALGGRLTIGVFGFYDLHEKRAGFGPEISFGTNLGPIRLGGAGTLQISDVLAATLAVRVSTTSPNRFAFLAVGDAGVYYGGGTDAVFAPFVTLHVGMRVKAGPVAFELLAASISIYYFSNEFRFVPRSGVALLL
jgi:hypothetical protein